MDDDFVEIEDLFKEYYVDEPEEDLFNDLKEYIENFDVLQLQELVRMYYKQDIPKEIGSDFAIITRDELVSRILDSGDSQFHSFILGEEYTSSNQKLEKTYADTLEVIESIEKEIENKIRTINRYEKLLKKARRNKDSENVLRYNDLIMESREELVKLEVDLNREKSQLSETEMTLVHTNLKPKRDLLKQIEKKNMDSIINCIQSQFKDSSVRVIFDKDSISYKEHPYENKIVREMISFLDISSSAAKKMEPQVLLDTILSRLSKKYTRVNNRIIRYVPKRKTKSFIEILRDSMSNVLVQQGKITVLDSKRKVIKKGQRGDYRVGYVFNKPQSAVLEFTNLFSEYLLNKYYRLAQAYEITKMESTWKRFEQVQNYILSSQFKSLVEKELKDSTPKESILLKELLQVSKDIKELTKEDFKNPQKEPQLPQIYKKTEKDSKYKSGKVFWNSKLNKYVKVQRMKSDDRVRVMIYYLPGNKGYNKLPQNDNLVYRIKVKSVSTENLNELTPKQKNEYARIISLRYPKEPKQIEKEKPKRRVVKEKINIRRTPNKLSFKQRMYTMYVNDDLKQQQFIKYPLVVKDYKKTFVNQKTNRATDVYFEPYYRSGYLSVYNYKPPKDTLELPGYYIVYEFKQQVTNPRAKYGVIFTNTGRMLYVSDLLGKVKTPTRPEGKQVSPKKPQVDTDSIIFMDLMSKLSPESILKIVTSAYPSDSNQYVSFMDHYNKTMKNYKDKTRRTQELVDFLMFGVMYKGLMKIISTTF